MYSYTSDCLLMPGLNQKAENRITNKADACGAIENGKFKRRMHQLKVVFFLLCILLIIVVLDASLILAEIYEDDKPKYPQVIDEIIEKCTRNQKVPGLIIDVSIPGQGHWTICKGHAELEHESLMTPDTKVRIASITKTFTITVLLQLVQEGKLSLNDTLSKFIPWIPGAQSITLRQLCNHTSGIFNFGEDENFIREAQTEPLRKWSAEELVKIAVSHPPYNPPGEGYEYSSTNTVLAGMVIEKVTGRSVGEEITQRIIKPLGLTNTIYPVGPETPEELAKGYIPSEKKDKFIELPPLDPSMGGASLAMISNVHDLRLWAKALCAGAFLTPEIQKERLTFVDTDSPVQKSGLGIMKIGDFLFHEGMALGFTTVMLYEPSQDASIIVITNISGERPHVAEEITKGLIQAFFPKSTALIETQEKALNRP